MRRLHDPRVRAPPHQKAAKRYNTGVSNKYFFEPINGTFGRPGSWLTLENFLKLFSPPVSPPFDQMGSALEVKAVFLVTLLYYLRTMYVACPNFASPPGRPWPLCMRELSVTFRFSLRKYHSARNSSIPSMSLGG